MAVGDDTFVTVNKGKIEIKADTLNIGDVIVTRGAVKGNKKGVLELGGAIKITGPSAQLNLDNGVKSFKNLIKKEVNERKKEEKNDDK